MYGHNLFIAAVASRRSADQWWSMRSRRLATGGLERGRERTGLMGRRVDRSGSYTRVLGQMPPLDSPGPGETERDLVGWQPGALGQCGGAQGHFFKSLLLLGYVASPCPPPTLDPHLHLAICLWCLIPPVFTAPCSDPKVGRGSAGTLSCSLRPEWGTVSRSGLFISILSPVDMGLGMQAT